MVQVAHRGLRNLGDEGLCVSQENELERAALRKPSLESLRRQAIRPARALHHGAVRRGLTPHEERYADHALAADDGELCRIAAGGNVEQGHDALDREIYVVELPA